MAELNFVVDQTALQTIQNTKLTANFEEMETALKEFVAPYESLIVTEDAVSLAKNDRAKLRSVANHIDSYRKSVKSIYTTPLKEFEEKCKRLTGIIDKGVSNLDGQVKEFEEKRKEEKLFLLRDYFDNQQKNMKHPEYISWELVENPKWGNVTYSTENAHKDIDIACMGTDKDVDDILALSSEFQLSLLDEYRRTHNVFDAFHLQERLALQKQREEQKQAELEAQYKEERAKKTADLAQDATTEQAQPEEPEQMYVATYKVYGTAKELDCLNNLLKTLRVKYIRPLVEATDEPAEAVLK